MRLIGIDLSWKTENNPSALAVGRIVDGTLQVEHIETGLQSVESILTAIHARDEVIGVAIDAPLIIENHNGQRACEKAVGQDYGGRKASCHTSNKSLYPDSLSVHLSSLLQKSGFQHLKGERWQIECYPHPSIIECFGLSERLAYKKGQVCEKKSGQAKLAKFIGFLEHSKILPLKLLGNLKVSFSDSEINELQGKELKSNEDALDSVICLYIAGLYHEKVASTLYGDSIHGYIWIPQIKCI